jgi:hypothetical protein
LRSGLLQGPRSYEEEDTCMSSIAGASECRGLCFGLVTILSQDSLAFQRTDCTPHHATPKCAQWRAGHPRAPDPSVPPPHPPKQNMNAPCQ